MASKRSITDNDITTLRALLSHTEAQVLSPSDASYTSTVERWSRAAEKPAGVSIVPTCGTEVSIAIRYATERNIDVAVKGGGHSTAGASSTHGGMLIDLGSGMNQVTVDVEKRLLHVDGGALWGTVDEAAWKHGLATVGGTVADTGVGGLTLGAGYGVLTGEHGLVIDNLISATVVLANGDIVRASDTENADMFWALRGAGQNFGVTTEFVLGAFPQKEMFTGMLLFAPTEENVTKLTKAVNMLYKIQHTPQGPTSNCAGRAMTLFAFAKPPPAGGQIVILVLLAFNGPEAEGREMYKEFIEVGPIMDTLRMAPYCDVNKQAPAERGMRSSMKGAAFIMPMRDEFVLEMLKSYEDFTSSNDDTAASVLAWELYDPSLSLIHI